MAHKFKLKKQPDIYNMMYINKNNFTIIIFYKMLLIYFCFVSSNK